MHDKLAAKVNNIDTSGFLLKTKYETDKSDLEKKISSVGKKVLDPCEVGEKPDYNAKTTEIEGNIPSIAGFATAAALTLVENKIPDISNLVKAIDYDAEILEIKSKYFPTCDYNKFTNEKLDLKKSKMN